MRKFFKSTTGAILVIVVYSLFWFWVTKSYLQIGFSLFFTGLFFGVEKVRKVVSRNPRYIHYNFFAKKLSESQKNIIWRHYSFYRRLKPEFQRSFDTRVYSFLERYQIIGRQGMEADEEKKILIASCYAQLTFGMHVYLNKSFNKILLYPDYYYSNITKNNHLGEFNPHLKVIVFSWKHFFEGIKIDDNNYNLGIHEFSHAILSSSRITRSRSQTVAEHDFEKGYRRIMELLKDKSKYAQLYNSGYLRKYAFANNDEFISVILEHFFETPDEFRTKFPDLFQMVKEMINYREEWFQT
ncbi:zinc-dependent peptidase [uncultured Chryseobacterium sp.]|uniref:zinc-dependent peptidase n=1 Tax=uncultured Chryseobacterium sp. TaxID=259322 RepID=UPI002606FED8|nr:zinc-dependent peptidase [uncultured Chryseobacterium sp.]